MSNGRTTRVRSTIKFPYNSLNEAEAVATTIAEKHGTTCTLEALAADFDQTVTSGAFRLKVAAAQTFGVITATRGQLTLTDLGRQITDPQTAATSRVTAFLKVPLYKALYEEHRGHRLPGDVGLEEEIRNLGVSAKQADKARQAFQRSAKHAGFFDSGSDRLVPPSVSTIEPVPPTAELETPPPPPAGLALRSDLAADPLLVGLLNKLPAPGGEFSKADQEEFKTALGVVFGYVYKQSSDQEKVRSDHAETGDTRIVELETHEG